MEMELAHGIFFRKLKMKIANNTIKNSFKRRKEREKEKNK